VRFGIAAVAVLAVAMAVVAVLVVRSDQDHVPGDLRDCFAAHGIDRIISNNALGPAATDLQAGRLHAFQQLELKNGHQAWFFAPPQRDYAVVAVAADTRPPEAVLRTVGAAPQSLVIVGEAQGGAAQAAARACIERQAETPPAATERQP